MKKNFKKSHCPICKKMFAHCGLVSHLVHAHDKKGSEAMSIVRPMIIVKKIRSKNALKPYYSKIAVVKDLENIIKKLKGN